jgi:hypothetical protein
VKRLLIDIQCHLEFNVLIAATRVLKLLHVSGLYLLNELGVIFLDLLKRLFIVLAETLLSRPVL